ncbi:Choline-sulfatase [Planctomycetales bacterium 10988]|nr:Choline-sulfatase [Planctomycetales bacterium 10988]
MKKLLYLFVTIVFLSSSVAFSVERPNIVVLLCDDFNPFYTGFAGDPDAQTPRLDALAKESLVFKNCYTASPVCMPARTSLVTGLFPHSTGCWGNASDLFVNPELTSMFRGAAEVGYATAMIGKTHWFSGRGYRREFNSVEEYFHQGTKIDFIREIVTTFGSRQGRGEYQDYLREIGKFQAQSQDLTNRLKTNQYVARPSLLEPEETCDWMMTDIAVDYLRNAQADRPFFLMVGYSNPHSPFDPAGRFAEMYDPESLTLRENVTPFQKYGTDYTLAEVRKTKAAYLGKISLLDELAGRVIDTLRDQNLLDNTIFVFTADHGMTIGEHRNISKGKFWEEVARVPLLIRFPGLTDAGEETEALCQLIDLHPTLVEAAGGEVSPHVSGRSLLPILQEPSAEIRDAAFCEISNSGHFNYMVRSDRFKWFIEAGREYLFDLEADPFEMKNLINSQEYIEDAQAMRERLRKFLMTEQLNYSAGYVPLANRLKTKDD